MSILNNSLLLGAPAGATTYQVSRSLRFNAPDSAYLNRTPSVAGNRKTWTWAGWVKRSKLGGLTQTLMDARTGSNESPLCFNESVADTLSLYEYNSNYIWQLRTTQVFRDASAWYHMVAAVDTTQATASNRVKIYVNRALVTDFAVATYPSQNYDTFWNTTNPHVIGQKALLSGSFYDGYLADIYFIDGQALDPSSFTTSDLTTGQLIPKAYTGSYGTNGFHLPFSDNSATTATTLGKDTSGNGNNWTPSNFSVAAYTKFGYPSDLSVFNNFRTNEPASYAFDGSLLTGAASITDAQVITWSPSNTITATTSLQILMQDVGGGVATVNSVSMSQGAAGPNGSDHYYNYTGSFPITITSLTSKANSQASRLYAILVDGNIVVSPSVNNENDSLIDTPSSYGTDTGTGGEVRGNYCIWNPLTPQWAGVSNGSGWGTLSNGNLDVSASGLSQAGRILGTFYMRSGKWYWETTVNSTDGMNLGIAAFDSLPASNGWLGTDSKSYGYWTTGQKQTNGSFSSYGASYGAGDVIGIAFDADNGTLTFYKNGSSQGTAFTGLTSGPYVPGESYSNRSTSTNFGQRQWAYQAPAGFKALCDTNLPAPVVAKPSTVMDVKLYTGNGGTQTISGLGFSPDVVWLKSRSGAFNHALFDTVRSAGYQINPNLTDAETLDTTKLSAFTSDGFTLGSAAGTNGSGSAQVAWCWDAGTSTVTDNTGSIQSTRRTNASAGFSVITWTGNSTDNSTIGHGLGVTPQLVITKRRDSTSYWLVYHVSLGKDKYIWLNDTSAAGNLANYWGSTGPTSSTIQLSQYQNNTGSMVAYAFAPVTGYSSFGSYTGNGSADGPFVYTGFRPRWILCKLSSASGADWLLFDTARSSYNVCNENLRPNTSSAEDASQARVDILSNGFKVKAASGVEPNQSGGTYIYAAFAENPFQYARAR